jgi:hypothetical protein
MNLKIIDLIYLRASLARGFPEAIYIIRTQTGTPIFSLIFCFLLNTRLDFLLKHENSKLCQNSFLVPGADEASVD